MIGLPFCARLTASFGAVGKVPLVTWMYVVTITSPPAGIANGEIIGSVCVNVVVVVTVPGRNRSQVKVIGCPTVAFVLVSSWIGGAKALPSHRSERRILASSLTINCIWSEYGLELSVIARVS